MMFLTCNFLCSVILGVFIFAVPKHFISKPKGLCSADQCLHPAHIGITSHSHEIKKSLASAPLLLLLPPPD